MIEKIYNKKQLYALIVRRNYTPGGVETGLLNNSSYHPDTLEADFAGRAWPKFDDGIRSPVR